MTLHARIRRVERAVLFMESRLFEPFDAADVAAAAGGSVSELHRLFSEVYGLPLLAYARARRLSEGARMLTETSWAVLEIANRCGYASQAAFTRAFRKQFRIPPARYRLEPPVSYRRVLPAGRADLVHRDGLSAEPRLHWQHTDVVLRGVQGPVDPEDHRDFVALGDQLRAAVGDQVATGLLRPGAGPPVCFLGIPGDHPLPEIATLQAGPYAVFEHRGPASQVRDTLGFLAQSWETDLLVPAARVPVERFDLSELHAPSITLELWAAVEAPGG